MIKSQNTKNEQQKDLCITSEQLTEQWKKGELLEDFYYAKCPWCDEVDIRYIHNGVDDYEDIIMLVPSYEEWKQKNEENERLKKWCEEFNALDVAKENAQLKELLKECRGLFNRSTVDGEEPNNEELIMILTKIDEALR